MSFESNNSNIVNVNIFDDFSKPPLLRVAIIKPILNFAIKENNLSLLYKCATLCKEWNEAVETYALDLICERIPRCFPLLHRRNFSRLPSDPSALLFEKVKTSKRRYDYRVRRVCRPMATGRVAFARQFYLRCSDYIASVRDTDYTERYTDNDSLAQLLQTDADMNLWVIELMIKIYAKLSHLGSQETAIKRRIYGANKKKKNSDDDDSSERDR